MNENSVLIVGSIGLDTIETPTQRQENIIGGSTTYSFCLLYTSDAADE